MSFSTPTEGSNTQDGSGGTTVVRVLNGVPANALVQVPLINRDMDDFPVDVSDNVNGPWPDTILRNTSGGARLAYLRNSAAGDLTITLNLNRVAQGQTVASAMYTPSAGGVTLHDSDITQVNGSVNSHPMGAVDATSGMYLIGVSSMNGGDSAGYNAPTNWTQLDDGGGFRRWGQWRIAAGTLTGEAGTWSSGGDSFSDDAVMAVFVETAASSLVVDAIEIAVEVQDVALASTSSLSLPVDAAEIAFEVQDIFGQYGFIGGDVDIAIEPQDVPMQYSDSRVTAVDVVDIAFEVQDVGITFTASYVLGVTSTDIAIAVQSLTFPGVSSGGSRVKRRRLPGRRFSFQ